MSNANYVKGRAFEHRVRKHYESMGYTVIRSAGSKGKIDLIAWHAPCDRMFHDIADHAHDINCRMSGLVKVIQCKIYAANAKKPLRTDLELLKQVKVPSSWMRVLAWKVNGESGFREEIV